ncbi:hypothetical protein AWZ03_003414 [Drosophila navojoa]|uniref:Thymidylate kinase n=1 Tax=Drosophila navojoa TaxID=7232 RepID=A0A484BN78_DRONA|nr:thymidylate kinase [Drosophila navojoa]TDG50198.1 hypothetical protein AWZ03_003414 [Drosophila navojoa]
MESNKRGAFIVFEGCDRVGKSTQSNQLFERLKDKGVAVKKINFPNRSTIIGDVINRFLKNTEELSNEVIHLLFSANRWECISSIQADLMAGTTIICDRYAYSGVVYSVAKGLDFDWCWAPDLGLLKPDVVFYLKANPDQLASRDSFGNERYEKLELQRKVSELFDHFNERESSYWHQFDAFETKQELHSKISTITENLLLQVAEKPLERLT